MHWKLSSAFLRIQEAFSVLSSRSLRRVSQEELRGLRTHDFGDELHIVGAFVFYANQDGSGRDAGTEFA